MKSFVSFFVFAVLIFTFSTVQDAHAGVPTTTAVQNGDWNTGATWVGGAVPASSNDKIIPTGITVTISSPVTNSATITNSGTIQISNTAGTGLTNSGTIANSGTITVSNTGGDGISNTVGAITNNLGGTITVSSSGIGTGLINSGTINNLGGTIAILIEGSIDNSNIFSNSGTITISNSIGTLYAINNGATFSNSGTITISNTSGDGMDNSSGTFTNSGTITIQNSGTSTGIYNDSTFTNSGIITVSNTGGSSKGIENVGGGTINNKFGSTITNSGVITNLGIINNECGSTYSGPALTGTVNECPSCIPPGSGDWVITSSCQLSSTTNELGNVTVQDLSVLVIPNGKTLNIDFAANHLLIKSGSKVLIKSGGKIF